MIPMTRPVTIVIHEQVYESLRAAAEEHTKGSVSKYIRLLVYTKLIAEQRLPMKYVEELY